MTTAESKEGGRDAAAAGLLSGKVCVVSGVGPGLGRQAARALAAHGADLVLAARRQSTLDDVLAEVAGMGARAITVATNIVDPDACARLMAAAAEEFGGVDVLVNNAFRPDVFQSFEDVDLTVWRKIMDVNVFGSLQMTRAALPFMRRRGGGSVVMVASMVARQPQPGQGGYAISKGALLTATRVLADELGPSNVRVNAVVPGWMAGPSVDIYIDMTSAGRGVPAQEVVEELNARVPLGRIPSDEDVAGSIVFLASDLSSAMTGQALDTNGGEIFA
ncbi:MAG: SDR family oxidoreductase [Acidimicrobiales bacterium]|jgi:NAD(P)-dependent dehydrogenase (short-subunit alcohol dehydrogenase family)